MWGKQEGSNSLDDQNHETQSWVGFIPQYILILWHFLFTFLTLKLSFYHFRFFLKASISILIIYIYIYIYIYTYIYSDITMHLAKAGTTINRLLIIWKSNLSDKIKCNFFQAEVLSILLYECTWKLTKHLEKKLDGNCTRMPQAILNKSWKQHPTKQQLYGHLFPISRTIQIKQTKHMGYF